VVEGILVLGPEAMLALQGKQSSIVSCLGLSP
jgi:hypothetical protein